jgi:hypothetical protein
MWGGLTYVRDVSHQLPPRSAAATTAVAHDAGVVTEMSGGYSLRRSSLNAERARCRKHPLASPLISSLSFPSPARSCRPLAVPLPAMTRSRRGARRRSRRRRRRLHISETRSPEREPQQEHLGGPRGEGRRRCLHLCRAPGDRGSQRRGRPRETEARPSEGEREEDRFRGGCCSFITSPSWTTAGQQEQEGPRCLWGRRLHFREAPSNGYTSSGAITALAGETGAPTAGLHLGRGMVHLHHPRTCRCPGSPPPSDPVHELDGRPGDGL